jgi:hypothetical protein
LRLSMIHKYDISSHSILVLILAQMPGLIPMIKKVRPDLPIIYRSHIEIRSDLVHQEGSAQAEVWKYLWDRIQLADLFISEYRL